MMFELRGYEMYRAGTGKFEWDKEKYFMPL